MRLKFIHRGQEMVAESLTLQHLRWFVQRYEVVWVEI